LIEWTNAKDINARNVFVWLGILRNFDELCCSISKRFRWFGARL